MPTKIQLLDGHRTERDRERQRAILQGQVIEALPDGLDVRKAYTSLAHLNGRSAMQGIYEFECETYDGLRRLLAALAPCKTLQVVMYRGDSKTTSFYPADRVPREWHDEYACTWVEGYVWEARGAGAGQKDNAHVSVEWYTEPRAGLFVLCRAYVRHHKARYRAFLKTNGGLTPWTLREAPSGQVRRVVGTQGHKPSVTVYWYDGSFDDAGQFVDHLEGGPTQNV